MKRKSFPRAKVFLAGDGKCHLCSLRIAQDEPWEAEHVIALECGGADDLGNLRPAHVHCHAVKTKSDRKIGAKLTRLRWKHGLDEHHAKPPRSIPTRSFEARAFPRHPTLKRGFDGKVVAR